MPSNPDGDDLRTYVNPTFTKGGRRNVEGSGSEDWADKVKMAPQEQSTASEADRHREQGYRQTLDTRTSHFAHPQRGQTANGVLNDGS